MSTHATPTSPVIPIATAIVLQGRESAGPFVVDALSPLGATLRGRSLGNVALAKATVVVSFPGAREMLHLEAAVAYADWQDGYCRNIVLRFHNLTADLQDQIQDIVAAHVERGRMPMVVILDEGRLEELGLRRVLHALGREVVFARSSLDALWLLDGLRESYGTILIDQSFIQANGPEILLFLHDRYPDKRRVLVVPRADEAQAHILASATLALHGVLTTPWTLEEIESMLGVMPAEEAPRARRILFVDDEPAVLAGLQHRLRTHLRHHDTVWVTSAEVALAESQARPFDVVVTDLRMPGMDGVTLLRAIKGQAPGSKRIILSGWETQGAKEVADVVLHKPCPLEQLRLEVLGARPEASDPAGGDVACP